MADSDALLAASVSMAQTAAQYGQAANLNKKNREFVEKQNALNRDLWREGQANSWQMWRDTNEYNSPANQRKLLEEAGYNPAALSQMNGAGNANQASFQPPPQGSAPQYQAADLSAIGQVFQNMASYAMAQKTKSEKTKVDIDNQFEAATKEQELKEKGLVNEAHELKNNFDRATFDAREDQETQTARKLGADASRAEAELRLSQIKQDIEEKYGKDRAEKEIKLLDAQYNEKVSQVGLNEANEWLSYKTGEIGIMNAETNRRAVAIDERQEEYERNKLIMEARKLLEEGRWTKEQYELFRDTAFIEKSLGIGGKGLKLLRAFFR